MTWHGYFAAEDLSLTGAQRSTLWTELQGLGTRNDDPQPHLHNHWRFNNDNSAVIFEAVFNDNVLNINTWKNRLSVLFGVDAGLITHAIQTPTFSQQQSLVVTFSYLAVPRFRVGLFGGVNTTKEQSRIEALAYLSANIGEWETGD